MNTVYFQVFQDNRDYVREKLEGNFYQPEATLKYSKSQSILFKYIKLPLSFSQCDHQFLARIDIHTINIVAFKIGFTTFSNEETLDCVYLKGCLYQKKITKISYLRP